MSERLDERAIAGALTGRDRAPAFRDVFREAEHRYRRRSAYRIVIGIAATVLVSFALLQFLAPAEPDIQYIEMAELLETTRWRAPSDALLPNYSAGIYDELPAIPVSTEPAEGALL